MTSDTQKQRWLATATVAMMLAVSGPVGAGTQTYAAEFVGKPELSTRDFEGDGTPDAVVIKLNVTAHVTDFFHIEGFAAAVDDDGQLKGPGDSDITQPILVMEGATQSFELQLPGGNLGELAPEDTLRIDAYLYRGAFFNQVGHLVVDVSAAPVADVDFPPAYISLDQTSLTERTEDADGDGNPDSVVVEFDVRASRPGLGVFWYHLGFDNGTHSEWLRLDPEWEANWTILDVGETTVTLRLPAAWMASTGYNGSWTVEITSLFSITGNDDRMFWAGNLTHATLPYDPDNLDADPPVTFDAPRFVTWGDAHDGQIDQVNATLVVTDGALPGRLAARLFNGTGTIVDEATRWLSREETVPYETTFVFDRIDSRLVDPAHPLTFEVRAFPPEADTNDVMAVQSWPVGMFVPDDFEPRRVAINGTPSVTPVDDDMDVDGLHEAINGTIPVTLHGAGSFRFAVSAATVDGDTVRRTVTRTFDYNGFELDDGDHDLPFQLPTYPLRATGWNGTYRVFVEQTSWRGDSAYADVEWNHTQFQGPPVNFVPGSVTEELAYNATQSINTTLNLTAEVDVAAAGNFEFVATLFGAGADGSPDPWQQFTQTRSLTFETPPGPMEVTWGFDGRWIHHLADDTPVPFRLTVRDAGDHDPFSVPLGTDFDETHGDTAAYVANQFIKPPIRLGDDVTVRPVDDPDDADSLFDRIEVDVAVLVPHALLDSTVAARLGWGTPETGGPDYLTRDWSGGSLPAGSTVLTFSFDGRHLGAAGHGDGFWVELEAESSWEDPISDIRRVPLDGIGADDFEKPAPDAHEPDDTPAEARPLETGVPADGNLFPYPNPDWFAFDADAGTTYLIKAVPTGSPPFGDLDATLALYGPDVDFLAFGGSAENGPRLVWTADTGGAHFIKTFAWSPWVLDFETEYALLVIPDADPAWRHFNQDPTAAFSVETGVAAPGERVAFQDESIDADGFVAAWHWDFGDGNTSTEPNAEHAYAANGTYAVTLRVTDDEGESVSATHNLVVEPYATVENLTVEAWDPNTMNVTFDTVGHGPLQAVTTTVTHREAVDPSPSQPPIPLGAVEADGFGKHSLLLAGLQPATEYLVTLATDVGDEGTGTIGPTVTAVTPGEPTLAALAAVNATPVGIILEFEIEADNDNWSSFVRYGPAADELVNETDPVNGTGAHAVAIDELEPGSTYYYEVVATMGGYENATTVATFDTLSVPPPPTLTAPTTDNVTATTVRVAWTLSGEEAARSRVSYGTRADGLNITSAWLDGPGGHNVTLAGLKPDQTYYFTVEADQLYGAGSETTVRTFSTTLLRPAGATDPVVVDADGTAATVTWTVPPSEYLMHHRIHVREVDGDLRVVDAGSGVGDMSHRIESLRPNTTYSVKVNVTGANRIPDESNTTSFRTPKLVLPAVTNLTVTATRDGALLAWDAPQDAAGYLVWRSQSPMILIAKRVGNANTAYLDQSVNATANAAYIVTYYTNATAEHATDSSSVPPTTEGHVTLPAGAVLNARADAEDEQDEGFPWLAFFLSATAIGAIITLGGLVLWRTRRAGWSVFAQGEELAPSHRVAWTPLREPLRRQRGQS